MDAPHHIAYTNTATPKYRQTRRPSTSLEVLEWVSRLRALVFSSFHAGLGTEPETLVMTRKALVSPPLTSSFTIVCRRRPVDELSMSFISTAIERVIATELLVAYCDAF
jgi:hypothetical protein